MCQVKAVPYVMGTRCREPWEILLEWQDRLFYTQYKLILPFQNKKCSNLLPLDSLDLCFVLCNSVHFTLHFSRMFEVCPGYSCTPPEHFIQSIFLCRWGMRTLYRCVCMCALIQLIIYCQLQRIKLQSVLVGHRTLARCRAIGHILSTAPGTMQLQQQGVGIILRKVLQGMPGALGARGSRLYSQPQDDLVLEVP